jgi:hypothetical protein
VTGPGFERRFVVGWGQADRNGPVRNSANLDFATDTRMMFFAASGFAPAEFTRLLGWLDLTTRKLTLPSPPLGGMPKAGKPSECRVQSADCRV